jgi:hypothetical protein
MLGGVVYLAPRPEYSFSFLDSGGDVHASSFFFRAIAPTLSFRPITAPHSSSNYRTVTW